MMTHHQYDPTRSPALRCTWLIAESHTGTAAICLDDCTAREVEDFRTLYEHRGTRQVVRQRGTHWDGYNG